MRKLYTPFLVLLMSATAFVACSSGGPAACASTNTLMSVAVQHGYFTNYATKGGGGGGGGGGHSSGGGYHAPSGSGSHSGVKAPSGSGSHSVSGSRASSYKGPTSVSHSNYTYKSPTGVTHVYIHQSPSYYNGHYNAHTVWLPTDMERFDPYNPWNYYNPYSPYYGVHLASC